MSRNTIFEREFVNTPEQLAQMPLFVRVGFIGLVAAMSRAYSTRLVRAEYAGPLFRVRRASDNAELDCYSVADAIGFVGVSSGYITKWYDQSGNGRHLAQTNAAAQPAVIASGTIQATASGARMAPTFDKTDDYLNELSSGAYAAGAASSFTVLEATALSTTGRAVLHEYGSTARYAHIQQVTGGTFSQLGRDNAATSYLALGTGAEAPQAFATGVTRQLTAIDTGSVFKKRVNRVGLADIAYTRAGTSTFTGFVMNAQGQLLDAFWGGRIAEYIEFRTAVSDTDRNIVELNQKAYYGL